MTKIFAIPLIGAALWVALCGVLILTQNYETEQHRAARHMQICDDIGGHMASNSCSKREEFDAIEACYTAPSHQSLFACEFDVREHHEWDRIKP